MARVTGPLFSLTASGSMAKTVTYSHWKGRPYVRELVIPANPRSAAQTATRAMMRFLTQEWLALPIVQTSWLPGGAAGKFSPFNYYVQYNMRRWTQFKAPSQTYPAPEASTPLAMTALTANAGVGQIDGTATTGATTDLWGFAIFASQTPAFTPSRNNARLILPSGGAAFVDYVLSGLLPGDWYVSAYTINNDGITGTPIADVGPVTVT